MYKNIRVPPPSLGLKPLKNGEFRDIWPNNFQMENNKGVDQTARMRRLVCTLVVRKQQSQGFSLSDPYDVETQASWPPPGYAPDHYMAVMLLGCRISGY